MGVRINFLTPFYFSYLCAKKYMWEYKGEIIDSIDKVPEGAVGFTYVIFNIDNDWVYYGKKILHFTRKTKISKREQEETNNRRKKNKIVVKESDWLTYTGSCKELNVDIKNGAKIKKIILIFCNTKQQLTYEEAKVLFSREALEDSKCYNNNILNRFYRGKIN